ncbi:MAG: M23 family metallopeptidase, partial [Rhodospirillales bacterium]|nr:M23 family metallopeptidase [Rhodospirillales bacterium]
MAVEPKLSTTQKENNHIENIDLPIIKIPSLIKSQITIDKGDTLTEILTRSKVSIKEATLIINSLLLKFNPKKLKPGDKIEISFKETEKITQVPETKSPNDLHSVLIDHGLSNIYLVTKKNQNEYITRKISKIVKRTTHLVTGIIESSLYDSALKSNLPPQLIMELIRIYSWDVDFQRNIQKGDSFRVLFEKYSLETGQISHYGNILYSSLILGNENKPLYRFDQNKTKVGYYDANGKSARKALMRTPINGARLSSGYGRRQHPILGYNKMHQGVDFAAPIGTPIFAAGNGTVSYKGSYKTYGNYLKIRHNSTFTTAYAHLSKFHKFIKLGVRVKQGQIIGYVGTTGRSTGPHLHYEILKNRRRTNPLK